METKELGTKHGEATRARFEAVATRVVGVRGTCLQFGKRTAGYVAGFAQGLLRPRTSCPNG